MKHHYRMFWLTTLLVSFGTALYTPAGHVREAAGAFLTCVGFLVALFAIADAIRDGAKK